MWSLDKIEGGPNFRIVPIYEYRCLKEGHLFEAIQKFSDAPLKECEVCQGPVEKLVSTSAFHLKGGGWYVTDYKNQAKTSSSGPSKAATTSEKKPEVKEAKEAKETATEVKPVVTEKKI